MSWAHHWASPCLDAMCPWLPRVDHTREQRGGCHLPGPERDGVQVGDVRSAFGRDYSTAQSQASGTSQPLSIHSKKKGKEVCTASSDTQAAAGRAALLGRKEVGGGFGTRGRVELTEERAGEQLGAGPHPRQLG